MTKAKLACLATATLLAVGDCSAATIERIGSSATDAKLGVSFFSVAGEIQDGDGQKFEEAVAGAQKAIVFQIVLAVTWRLGFGLVQRCTLAGFHLRLRPEKCAHLHVPLLGSADSIDT